MKKIFLLGAVLTVVIVSGLYARTIWAPDATVDSPNEVVPEIPTTTENPTASYTTTASDEKSGIEFTYPTEFDYQYVSKSEWPPRFISSYAPIDCELEEQTKAMSGLEDETRIINGTTYCIWTGNEGAAGSTYTNYQVSFEKDSQYVTMSFTLRYPQCGNYPENEMGACQTEQKKFPLNNLIDKIAQSTVLPTQ